MIPKEREKRENAVRDRKGREGKGMQERARNSLCEDFILKEDFLFFG